MGLICSYYDSGLDLTAKVSTASFFEIPSWFSAELAEYVQQWTLQHLQAETPLSPVASEHQKRMRIIQAQLTTNLDTEDDVMRIASPRVESAFSNVSSPIRKKEYIALFRVLEKARQLVIRRFILLKDDALIHVTALRSFKAQDERAEASIEFTKLFLRDLYWNRGLQSCPQIFRTREIQEVLEEMLEDCLMGDTINSTPLLPKWFLKSCVSHAWVAFLWSPAHHITVDYLEEFDLERRADFLFISEEEKRYFLKHLGFLYNDPRHHHEDLDVPETQEDHPILKKLKKKNKVDHSYLYDFAATYLPDVSGKVSTQSPTGLANSIVG
jgi:hypothetical protein